MLVTEAEPVYITGAVMSPGGIYLREQLMLSRALAMVGGARKEAKLTDVRVFRQVPGSANQEVINVDVAAIKKNEKPDFLLQAYDVIEVAEAGMFSSSRIASTLMGAISGGITAGSRRREPSCPAGNLLRNNRRVKRMNRKTMAGDRRRRKLITALWALGLAAVVITLIYLERTAILYILCTLGVTALLVIVAFSDLAHTDAKSKQAADAAGVADKVS